MRLAVMQHSAIVEPPSCAAPSSLVNSTDKSSRSGHQAFDDYRTETLRRLEEEQREFQEFLRRLRAAKDKQEFDQFMDERRGRSSLQQA